MKWLLGLLLLPLAACASYEADIPAIEREVESGIEDQTDVGRVVVDCPDQITWRSGGEFHCFAEDPHGQTSRVTVSMENDAGEWSWTVG